MKKLMISFITMLFVAVSFGQIKHVPIKLATEKSLQISKGIKANIKADAKKKTLSAGPMKAAMAPTRAGSADVIYDEPEGTTQYYSRAGGAWYATMLGMANSTQSGFLHTVVAEDGKTIYFKDIISQAGADSWVKGEFSADGKTISIPMGQFIYYDEIYNDGYQLAWCVLTYNGKDIDVTVDESMTVATLSIDENGVLSVDGSAETENEDGSISYSGIGLTMADGSFGGYLDYSTVYTPSELPENIAAPADLQTESYSLLAYGFYDDMMAKIVKAGWDGDDFWIQGLEDYFPEAWIKGTKKGDKVVFETPQFLGFFGPYTIYLVGGVTDPEEFWVLSDNIVMDYDEEAKTLSLDKDHALVTNAALDRIYYMTLFGGATMAPYKEVAATPKNPSILGYNCTYSLNGNDNIICEIPVIGTNGEFLNPANITYKIFVDGKPFTFAPDAKAGIYPELKKEMTEIPYTFTDDYYDFAPGASQIFFYETAFRTIGIQSLYYGAGEVHESEVVTVRTNIADANDVERIGVYRSFDGDEEYTGEIGTGRIEKYDVATFIQDANLVGAKVTGMTILTTPKSKDMLAKTAYKGWLSKALALTEEGEAEIELEGESKLSGNKLTVKFTEPYEVPAEGFFAGYSFSVNSVNKAEDQEPVLLAAEPAPNGFFIHTSRSYHNWVNAGAFYKDAILPVLLTYEDGSIKEVGARFVNIGEYYAKSGEPTLVNVSIANNGLADITSIDAVVNVNGQEIPGQYTFDTSVSGAYYGQQTDVTIEIPAISTIGSFPFSLSVTKVNGIENQVEVAGDSGLYTVISFVPKHRVLVEEYTGTWCGWCPRGLVGMAMLAKEFGEDFVGVAYHNGDPMESLWTEGGNNFPSYIEGYPSAIINRMVSVDPYYGSTDDVFGIKYDVEAAAATMALMDVSVKGEYDNESNSVIATAETKFITASKGGRYAIEFIAVENDIHGEGDEWVQHNYYPTYAEAYSDEPNLGWLTTPGMDNIVDYHFNDVFLFSSRFFGVDEDLPETIEADGEYTCSTVLPVAYMLNAEEMSISQNVNNMEVVALVIDTTTGEVVNAAKSKVITDVSGITNINVDSNTSDVYNLQGLRVQKGYKGIVIMNGKKYITK